MAITGPHAAAHRAGPALVRLAGDVVAQALGTVLAAGLVYAGATTLGMTGRVHPVRTVLLALACGGPLVAATLWVHNRTHRRHDPDDLGDLGDHEDHEDHEDHDDLRAVAPRAVVPRTVAPRGARPPRTRHRPRAVRRPSRTAPGGGTPSSR